MLLRYSCQSAVSYWQEKQKQYLDGRFCYVSYRHLSMEVFHVNSGIVCVYCQVARERATGYIMSKKQLNFLEIYGEK